jgi:hypothetical protein
MLKNIKFSYPYAEATQKPPYLKMKNFLSERQGSEGLIEMPGEIAGRL